MSQADGKIAKRYARALFELCDQNNLESTHAALVAFKDLWENNKEMRDALKNPANPLPERHAALAKIAGRVKSGDKHFENFLALLLDNGRLAAIASISATFAVMIDQLRKRLALEITSAFPIDAGEQKEIQDKIQRDFGSLASISWQVAPEILGGLRIKAGDRLLDSSVNGALENLKNTLIS